MPKKTAQLIDGKALSTAILLELRKKIDLLQRPPGLAAILIGDDPASASYIKNKKRACTNVGITFSEYRCGTADAFPDITEQNILDVIDFLNADAAVDGIIVQLPLPKQFNTETIINRIDPKKDVYGFIANKDAVLTDSEFVVTPPLIDAIYEALRSTNEPLENKSVAIISKNPIFSTPLAQALKSRELGVTVVTPDDEKLSDITSTADVVIAVVGRPAFVKKEMIKPDAIVVDVGSTLVDDEWIGDVDLGVRQVASWVTPVPGGVGPLTVAMLLKNTLELSEKNQLTSS